MRWRTHGGLGWGSEDAVGGGEARWSSPLKEVEHGRGVAVLADAGELSLRRPGEVVRQRALSGWQVRMLARAAHGADERDGVAAVGVGEELVGVELKSVAH